MKIFVGKNMFLSSSPRPLTHCKDHSYRVEIAGSLVKNPEAPHSSEQIPLNSTYCCLLLTRYFLNHLIAVPRTP